MRTSVVVKADQLAPVPAVQRIGRILGHDHRAVVGVVLVDRAQVERHLRRGRRTDGDGAALPRHGDAAVQMAADQAAHLGMAADDVGEGRDPRFVGVGVHPLDAAFDRRVVHDDIGRLGRILRQFCIEPGGAAVAKGAAMAPLLERVDRHQPQFGQVDRILDKAVAVVEARELRMEIVAQVMVADARPYRKGAARKGGRQPSGSCRGRRGR